MLISRHDMAIAHVNSHQLWFHARNQASQHSSVDGRVLKPPPLVEELLIAVEGESYSPFGIWMLAGRAPVVGHTLKHICVALIGLKIISNYKKGGHEVARYRGGY